MFALSSHLFLNLFAQAQTTAASTAWYQTNLGALGLLIGTIVACYLVANSFTKSIRMPEQMPRIWIMLMAFSIAGLVILAKWPPKFGVDLRGGIQLIGQVNLDAMEDGPKSLTSAFKIADIIPVLSQRINPGGVSEIVIRNLGADKLEVIIPEVDEAAADDIWNRLVKTGHLQFRIIAQKNSNHNNIIAAAEQMAKEGNSSRTVMITGKDGNPYVAARWFSLAREFKEKSDPKDILPIKFVPFFNALVRDRQTGRLIDMNSVSFRSEDRGMDFARWLDEQGIRSPQVLVLEPNEAMNVEGKHLTNIMPSNDQMGRPCVQFALRGEGVSRMFRLTTSYKPPDNGPKFQLGIVMDDQVQSAPEINSTISNSGIIEGRFTQKEINDLIVTLNSGKIDVALNPVPISKQFIQSTLGEELKQKGFYAIGISFVIVVLFVFVYYQWFAGTIANLALFLNLVLILALVMAINQPLTLTGLAGLVLTIGMAVDANVLIYERIREELQKGASLRAAFRTGFERATTTIVDSNLTTILSGIILYAIGTEQLKGFAVTLILGIVMGMFTAIFCSWTVFNISERRNWITKIKMMNFFETKRTFDFLGKQRLFVTSSVIAIALGMVGLFIVGTKIFDIDLRGGSTAQIVLKEKMTLAEVRGLLDKQQVMFGDEKAVFSATEVSESNKPETAGRTFKIDSNVLAPDVGKGDSWKRLDEMLEEIFVGKLEMHSVQFDANAIQTEKVGGATPSNSPATENKSGMIGWEWSQLLAHGFSLAPNGISTLSWMQDPTPTTPSIGAGQTTDQKPDPTKTDNQPPVEDATKNVQENLVNPPLANQPQQPETLDASASPNSNEKFRSKVNLTFKDPITGKSIRTMLVEASKAVDRPLEEEQIRLSSPDLPTEGSVLATPLKNWEIQIESPREDDAKNILTNWSATFNSKAYFPTNSGVGSQVAGDARWQAFAAVVASCIGMIVYIWIRFQNLAFGIAAVVALVHDVLITLSVLALSHFVADYMGFALVEKFKINLSIIAALLTIIGYSVNDTIVIFDRIREVRGKRIELTPEMVNLSVSQTLSRTILTSGTTFAVVFILYLLGGDTIHGFAFAMCVGVLVGTYSTVFIASPVAVWLINRVGLNANLAEEQAAKGAEA